MNLKLTTLSGAVICALVLSACGGADDAKKEANSPPPTPETRVVNVDMLGGRVAIPVQFVDAKTGQPITQEVTLIASDDISGDNVYENANISSANNTHETGATTVFIKADVAKTASTTNPVKFRLIASADGYFSSSVDVLYDGTTKLKRIHLVNKTDAPDGVAVAVQKEAKADSTGTLSTDLNLTATTTDTASKGASATFTLPTGTVLKDHTGEPLTGDLQVSIAYFSPKAENVGEIFPGGLNPDYVRVRENGEWVNQQGYFVTAGLLAVDIVDSQGRKAHYLRDGGNNAARVGEMTIQAPAGLINPETNEVIKDGDQIPVWSHNERTGLWQQESIGTFKQNIQGNFDVTYKVNHLSVWNLDWWGSVCSQPVKFNYNNTDFLNVIQNYRVDVHVNGSYYTDIHPWSAHHDANFSKLVDNVWNIPSDAAATFTYVDQKTGATFGTASKPANSCNAVNVTINDLSALPKPRNVSVQVLLTAPQGFTKAEISTLLSAMKSLTDAQREAVLKYTHPNDANAKFKLDQADYQKLMDIALSRGQVASLQALMSVQVKAQGYFWGYDQDWKYYSQTLSNTGGMTFYDLPSKDISFKGRENITYQYYDWWTGQYVPYTYTRNYAELYGYVQNSSGSWKYFNIPLKSPHTIKKEDTQTTIVFEDMEAMQRIIGYLNNQTTK